jgi:hypothetical protein
LSRHNRATRRDELYVGKLVWNRLRFIKDPETGKRVSRSNPESEWITHDVPDLRIIADDLRQAVKTRQGLLRSTRTGKRPVTGTGAVRGFCCPA